MRLFSSLAFALTNARDRVFLRQHHRGLVILLSVCIFGVVAMFSRSSGRDSVFYDKKFCEDPSYDGRPQQHVECTCADPPTPESWFTNTGWDDQHDRMVASASTSKALDLVFLGDSITERINGTRSLGRRVLPDNRRVFESHFTKSGGGDLEAIALGSSGDTTNNLLWHLENGMLPHSLQPKVWFVLIGTNNLGRSGCSQQSTLDGILAVLRHLQQKRPEPAKIVLHGLLPRSEKAMEDDDDYKVGVYWEKIQWINRRLKEACAGNCVYMESPELFLSDADTVNSVTMTDGLHPSTEGLELWEPKIAALVRAML